MKRFSASLFTFLLLSATIPCFAATTTTIPVTGAGSVTDGGATVNATYAFTAGTYTYTIAGFGIGDTLSFPSRPTDIINTSDTDGIVYVMWEYPVGKITVLLTGIPAAQDVVFGVNSFRNVFGPSSLLPIYLDVTITGAGSVNSNPSGIACTSGTCSSSFDPNQVVSLQATPSASLCSSLQWSGDCVGNGACSVTMSTDRKVTAQFLTTPPVKVGATTYQSLTAAYTAALTGSSIVLYAHAREFVEPLNLNKNVAVQFAGGRGCDFAAGSGLWTTLKGLLTVGKGSLVVANLVVK